MADLKLDVDIGSLLKADKAVKDFESRFNQLEQAARRGVASQDKLVTVFDRLEKAGLSLSQVYRGMEKDLDNNAKTASRLENEFRSLSLSGKSARDSARAMEQAFKEQERVMNEVNQSMLAQEQRLSQLKAKYDPLYAASMQYERALNEINEAHRIGAINTKQMENAVNQLDTEYTQFANGAAVAGNRFAQATQLSNRRLGQSQVIIQQSGYQIGDFLVQVQSGTNALVAFGQQATQVAGTLTLLGGKFLAIGTVLGIAIPLVTAIGAAFMRTREGAEDAAEGIQTLSDRIATARQQVADMTFEIEAMRRGFEDFREFALVQGVEEAQDRVRELSQQIYELEQLGTVTGPNERELELAQEALRAAQEQLEAYRQSREEHEGLTASIERGGEFAENLLTAYQNLRDMAAEIGDEFKGAQAEAVAEFEQKVAEAAEEARALKEEMAEAKREAEVLARLDLKSGIEAAAGSAAALATNLGISLQAAQALQALSDTPTAPMSAQPRRLMATGAFATGPARELYTPEGAGAPMSAQPNILSAMGAFASPLGVAQGASGRRGGGGGGAADTGIGGLAQSLLTEMEQIELFREDALQQLESFNSRELEILGGHAEARLRIEEEYQSRIDNLRQTSRQNTLSETASLFGQLANIASVGGERTVKAVATFQAIEGTINAYGAAIKALNTPGIGLAGRFAAYASVLAAGLKGVAAIRSAGGVGGGGGGSGVGTVAPIASSSAATPQRVIIEGIDRDSLISGEQLSRLFDKLYEENSERGIVFSVAR